MEESRRWLRSGVLSEKIVRYNGCALYSVRVYLQRETHGGLRREALAKRSGNTESIPSSYLNEIGRAGFFILQKSLFIQMK